MDQPNAVKVEKGATLKTFVAALPPIQSKMKTKENASNAQHREIFGIHSMLDAYFV